MIFPRDAHPDPRQALTTLVEQGYLAGDGAGWVRAWLDRLAPSALMPHTLRVVHGDARPTNVHGRDLDYRALLDWGDAQWARTRPPNSRSCPCGPLLTPLRATGRCGPIPEVRLAKRASSDTSLLEASCYWGDRRDRRTRLGAPRQRDGCSSYSVLWWRSRKNPGRICYERGDARRRS